MNLLIILRLGARIYFLKFIMHVKDCLRVLENVKIAMEEGYSYLVIEEFILPDEGCSLLPAEWDLMMMIYLCGMERTRSHWEALFKRADLEPAREWSGHHCR